MLEKLTSKIVLIILITLPLQIAIPKIFNRVTSLKEGVVLPGNFNKVYSTFNSFNKSTDTSLVVTFCNVSNLYGFDEDDYQFDWLIGQILLESGARQYVGDSIITSCTGAVGFAQILRSTSLLYLKKTITKKDSIIFNSVGVTDYSFVCNNKLNRRESLAMAKSWLSNVNNNIALWGKIMSVELKNKTMTKALISYNVGPRGLRRYINAGGVLASHHYIVGIVDRMRHIK